MRYAFVAVYVEARGGGVLAYIEELPGAHAQRKTIREAERHLRDAVDLTLRSNVQRSGANFHGLRVLRRGEFSIQAQPGERARGEA